MTTTRHPWGSLKATVAALDGCRIAVKSNRMLDRLTVVAKRLGAKLTIYRAYPTAHRTDRLTVT